VVTDHVVICGHRSSSDFIKAVSSDSDYVHDDTFSEMEEEGMEEIPKEILNVTDSFNVECDEEFLGFE